MDLADLRDCLAYGNTIEDAAMLLCRRGTEEEVRQKAREMGWLKFPAPDSI